MKKLAFLLVLVTVFLLLSATAASADVRWAFGYRNNTTTTVDDLHVSVWSDSSMTVPLNPSSSTSISPAGWSVDSIIGNVINMSGPGVSPGGVVEFSFVTTGGMGTKIWTSGEWTAGGAYVGDATDWDVLESNVIGDIRAIIARSIKLTLSSYDVDFGLIRPGKSYTQQVEATVESNGNWDLYAGGEDISPFRSLLEPSRLGIGTSIETEIVALSLSGTTPILQNRNWEIDSFFDVFYEIDLTGAIPHPGVYKARVNLNAVQNY